ncbi:hypothetical protein [Segniliparus rotundus]|nr:hypothetical protein [Segniliparus rotundus]
MSPIWNAVAAAITGVIATQVLQRLVKLFIEGARYPSYRKIERELELFERFHKLANTRPSTAPGESDLHAMLIEDIREHSFKRYRREYMQLALASSISYLPVLIIVDLIISKSTPEGWGTLVFLVFLMVIFVLWLLWIYFLAKDVNRREQLVDAKRERFRETGRYPKPGEVKLADKGKKRSSGKRALKGIVPPRKRKLTQSMPDSRGDEPAQPPP